MKLDALTPDGDQNASPDRHMAAPSHRADGWFGSGHRLLAGVLVGAALLAGCGGENDAANAGSSAIPPPANATDAGAPTDELPATPAVPPGGTTELPTATAEPPAAPAEPEYERADSSAPEQAVEPESDAGRWVDQRQDEVLDDVNDNNMDAVEGWTP